MRSLLTTLGIVIGVASVISMVAVGEGAKSRVESVFAAMGTNMLIVLSGSTTSGGVMRRIRVDADAHVGRPRGDSHASKRGRRVAAPVLSARVTIVSDEANWTTGVVGTIARVSSASARGASRAARRSRAKTSRAARRSIVLGQTTSDTLFGAGVDPLGRSVRIRSVPFQVVGVLERKGQSPWAQDYDDTAMVPVTAFQTKIQGGLQKFIGGAIIVSATSSTDTTRAQNQIKGILRDRHHIANATDDDFSIRNLTEIANAQQQGTKALTGCSPRSPSSRSSSAASAS